MAEEVEVDTGTIQGDKVGPGHPPKEHQFKPGESGNPAGKPKGAFSLKTIAKRILADPKTWDFMPPKIQELRKEIGNDKTFAEALVLVWGHKSLDDPRFGQLMLEIADAKGRQEVDLPEGGLFSAKKLVIEMVMPHSDTPKEEPDADNTEDVGEAATSVPAAERPTDS